MQATPISIFLWLLAIKWILAIYSLDQQNDFVFDTIFLLLVRVTLVFSSQAQFHPNQMNVKKNPCINYIS